ncbi:hypothetical protein BOH66_16075 [Microbacterium aurum]|uniref:Uncharacterized protein n=1 Tax=Microbacterium aurum TaxID=36805 RepID=A0A1P8UBR1_9MICO|nr:hypothetical protein [Microbacterium aurum]APZ35577.1 hypothetical protein BOH66_16075 [Microbacterium aurum]MBM7826294.1 hypothetical protein [Microbacterium aurum]
MSEDTGDTPPVDGHGQKRGRRRLSWIGGGVALVLVAGGIVAVPQIVHAQRVSEYAELVSLRDTAFADRAQAEATLEAAMALTLAQQSETGVLAQRLADLGQTPEPILPAQHAGELAAAGEAVASVIGEATEPEQQRAQAHERLVAGVAELQAQDQAARAEAEAAGEELPEPLAPASYLSLDIDAAAAVIGAEPVPEKVRAVADGDVTPELIEETRTEVASIEEETADLAALIRTEEQRMAEFTGAIESTVPTLRAAAEGAAAVAPQLVEHAPKAPDASNVAVTAAHQAQEIASTEDAARILDGLAAYVEAARAAQAEHEAVVQREAAEAAARAEAERRQNANREGNSGGGSKGSRLCSRYRPSPGGGGSLVLVYC